MLFLSIWFSCGCLCLGFEKFQISGKSPDEEQTDVCHWNVQTEACFAVPALAVTLWFLSLPLTPLFSQSPNLQIHNLRELYKHCAELSREVLVTAGEMKGWEHCFFCLVETKAETFYVKTRIIFCSMGHQ